MVLYASQGQLVGAPRRVQLRADTVYRVRVPACMCHSALLAVFLWETRVLFLTREEGRRDGNNEAMSPSLLP